MAGKNVLRGACAMALVLGGCSEVEEGQPESSTEVPPAIQQMMAADFPADGNRHEKMEGVFNPGIASAWCRAAPEIDSELRHVVPGLYGPGFGTLENGYIGKPLSNGAICSEDSSSFFSQWQVTKNRDGAPYKLILAVWQGDPADGGTIWIGGLERRGDLPDLPPPVDDMPSGEVTVNQQEIEQAEFVATVKWNLAKDVNALSKQFSEAIAAAAE